jgi:KDO2-lipid IV(A) lauroyltransferase
MTESRPAREEPRPTFAHRMEYLAVRAIFALLGLLPWNVATTLGERIGAFGYRPLGIRRGIVERQIAAAFPEYDRARVRDVARDAYRNLGRISVETALLSRIGPRGVLDLFDEPDGWEHIERAMAAKKGLVVVTGHFSNWEIGGAYIAARGVRMEAIVRRMANPVFDAYLTRTRERFGLYLVRDAEAVRRTPRAIREGHAVGFIADQGVKGLASTFVPFFGRPAKTPRGPAVFALRLGAPVVFAASMRLPNGRYRLIVRPVTVEDTGDRERDVDTVVARFTETLEGIVRMAPEQYFWHHRRWRRQPKDTPPELREP